MMKRIGFVCALVASSLAASATYAQERPASFADLVDKLSPAVVNISTSQKIKQSAAPAMPNFPDDPAFAPFRQFFEQFGQVPGQPGGQALEKEVTSLGSGFLIDASGYVVTNNHVVEQADEITVRLSDNSKFKAKLIGRDKKTDLALLKIEAKKEFPFVPLGDSDAARVGDWVIAIGNPYGLGGSVTQGIISARQRSLNSGPYDDFLQTDAPINRGNSGGPLFNMKGEVVGINSAIFSPSGGNIGIGFAIPTSLAKPVITQLKEYGRTHRGWLGVKIQEVTEEVADSVGLPKPYGAMIVEISKNGPSEKAGLKEGDIITHFDGQEIKEMRFLPRLVGETKIGKSVNLRVWRKGKEINTTVVLGESDEAQDMVAEEKEAPSSKREKSHSYELQTVLGMECADLTDVTRKQFGIKDDKKGIVVVALSASSEAGKRGFTRGDVIQEITGEAVESLAQAQSVLMTAQKSGRKFVLVKVARGKDFAFVTLPLK